jgi:hypothetical protein
VIRPHYRSNNHTITTRFLRTPGLWPTRVTPSTATGSRTEPGPSSIISQIHYCTPDPDNRIREYRTESGLTRQSSCLNQNLEYPVYDLTVYRIITNSRIRKYSTYYIGTVHPNPTNPVTYLVKPYQTPESVTLDIGNSIVQLAQYWAKP